MAAIGAAAAAVERTFPVQSPPECDLEVGEATAIGVVIVVAVVVFVIIFSRMGGRGGD